MNLDPLFDTIVNYIPAPEGDPTAPMQMLVSSIDYNDYVGRIGIGRVERGTRPTSIRRSPSATITIPSHSD